MDEEGELEDEGDILGDSELEGLKEDEGEKDGLFDDEGERELEGDKDGDVDDDGDNDEDGDKDGETDDDGVKLVKINQDMAPSSLLLLPVQVTAVADNAVVLIAVV